MSNSQYKDFISCEAMAMAKITGVYSEPPGDALLIGSYVHAAIEGTLDEFKEQTPELFNKKGELYAKYEHANTIVETLQNDPFIMFVLQGQKEVIVTAEFAGALWKAKLDVYNPEHERIADIKTVKGICDKYWDKDAGRYVSFMEAYGYVRQLAIYAELERIWAGRNNWFEPLVVAVSKEDPPDKEIISVDAGRMQYELEYVMQNMERINAVKSGLADPQRCEHCKYCRLTKKITKVTHYADLLGA